MNITGSRRNIFVLLLVFIAACAKISQPTGGARDKLPPVVIRSTPSNGATGFKGKKIELSFNEYVVLDNINEKLLVSPPLLKRPRTSIRGKSIIIEYDEELKDNTTYAFYFLDAIRDLNESNILDNYKFVFSTGRVIDSLSVTGTVLTIPDLEVPAKTSVLLYSNLQDSAVVKTFPDYISRVDPTGSFRFDNIRNGQYRLYALTDDDNSKNYNRVEEPFAFLDTLITVTTEGNYITPDTTVKTGRNTGGGYKLFLFKAALKSRYLTNSSRQSKYKLTYSLSLTPDSLDFTFSIPEVADDKYLIEKSMRGDTMTVWLTDSSLYSLPLISTVIKYPFTDSLGNDIYRHDTVAMRFLAPRIRGTKSVPKLSISNNIPGGVIKPGRKVVFTAETPLREPDITRTGLYEMIEKDRHKIPYSLQKDSLNSGKLALNAALVEGGQYLFIADSAAFGNIYNEVNDSLAVRFSVGKADSYSSISINVINCRTNCIIQLLSNSEKLIAEQVPGPSGNVEFKLLDRGTYRVRAIFDTNGDGRWTTGDFFTGRQPEPVSYLPKELVLQEGWQVKETWDLSVTNVKDPKLRQKANTTTR